jgi:hypothetical protein
MRNMLDKKTLLVIKTLLMIKEKNKTCIEW